MSKKLWLGHCIYLLVSRMDSCGVDGRVQVNQRTRDVMLEWYEFEERGEVFVKGKDNMKVFLLKDRKENNDEGVE